MSKTFKISIYFAYLPTPPEFGATLSPLSQKGDNLLCRVVVGLYGQDF